MERLRQEVARIKKAAAETLQRLADEANARAVEGTKNVMQALEVKKEIEKEPFLLLGLRVGLGRAIRVLWYIIGMTVSVVCAFPGRNFLRTAH